MEQAQRKSEETYRLHEEAKVQAKRRMSRKTVRRTTQRLAKRVDEAKAKATQPVSTPNVADRPMVQSIQKKDEMMHKPAEVKKTVLNSAASGPEQVCHLEIRKKATYPKQKGRRMPTKRELVEIAVSHMVNGATRAATVLWSERKGNQVPLQFDPPPIKIIHKKTMEKRLAVLNVPPPPAEDKEPARFLAHMEQAQRNSEETYRLHEEAKVQAKDEQEDCQKNNSAPG
jgi:hypothetical protein